jgi:hypothetical protein
MLWRPFAALLLLMFALPEGRPALAQGESCAEPNNGYSTACFIGPDGPTVQGTIDSTNDVDVYKFDLQAKISRVHIDLTNLPVDYDLHLFTMDGGLLAESVSTGTAPDVIDVTLAGGRGYVFVHSASGEFAPTAPYTLTVAVTPLGDPPAGSEATCPEPNNTLGQACRLDARGLAFSSLDAPDDGDVYQYEVTEADSLVYLRVIQPDGAKIKFETLEPDGSASSSYFYDQAFSGRQSAGSYVIRVSADEAGPTPTAYALMATVTSPTLAPTGGPPDACPEPNSGLDAACFIGPDVAAQGYISYPWDVDSYRFDVVGAQSLARVELLDLPADYDLYLQSAASGYPTLAMSDEEDRDPELIEITLDPGTYYLTVQSYDAQSSDAPYTLRLVLAPT